MKQAITIATFSSALVGLVFLALSSRRLSAQRRHAPGGF
jgi:hypothetical protein